MTHGADANAYGLWPVVIFNVVLLLGFVLSFLRPQARADWRTIGVFGAWLVALFTEMYGIPLTIYGLTALLGRRYPVLDPFSHKNGHLLVALAGGSQALYVAVMTLTPLMFWAAIWIMWRAWRQIYAARGSLITDGLYARVRHPQYSAMFLLIASLLIQWPTLVTLLTAPVLVTAYFRLAQREETALLAAHGDAYRAYMRQVPAFVPRIFRWRLRSTTRSYV